MNTSNSLEFNNESICEDLMGPNAVLLTAELCQNLSTNSDDKICDLGCGKGLSSLYLAQHTGCTVYACDLWISEEENRERFKHFGFDNQIHAVNTDAFELPFPESYFDILTSIDSYHYFGREPGAIDKVAQHVKPGGKILLAVPGLKQPLTDKMMETFSLSWDREAMETIRTASYWRELLEQSNSITVDAIYEMDCFEQAWQDWLSCDNEYAIGDRPTMEAGAGNYMNLIAVELTKK